MKIQINALLLIVLGLSLQISGAVAAETEKENTPDIKPADPEAVTPAPAKSAADSLLLGPNFKIRYQVDEDPQAGPPIDVQVLPLGQAMFPVTRESLDDTILIDVNNKTLGQVREELRIALEKDYYRKATVSLQILSAPGRQHRVTFSGEAKKKNIEFDASKPLWLYDAIIQVEYTEYASLGKVQISRRNPKTGNMDRTVHNVSKMISTGNREKDEQLQDGDIINIPAKLFNFR